MKKNLVIWIILILTVCTFAQKSTNTFRVKYVTGEHVYLDGGTAKGLSVGNELYVVRSPKEVIAKLEVVFVAENSASCKLLSSQQPVEANDIAVMVEKKEEGEVETPEEIAPEKLIIAEKPPETGRKQLPQKSAARVSGNVSLQFYHLDDQTESNLDFSRPALRVNIRARNLWGKDVTFRFRTRTLYNVRTRSYSLRVPETEWRNRVYELSLIHDNRQSRFNYKVGRIITNFISGIGYIDGAQLQHNFSPSLGIGVFAGTQPNLHNSQFETENRKYGAYVNYAAGSYQGSYFETTLAAAAQYHSSTVSREFVYFQNNFSAGSRLYLFQSAEVDINRQWRMEKTGQSVSLSNLFLSGRYRFSRAVTAGLIFDNRKNYWTYEISSIADSLFDDALRTGLRGNLSLRLPGDYFLYTNAGYRKRETDDKATYSFSGGLNKNNLLFRGLFINLNYAGFTNPVTEGYNGSARIGKSFFPGYQFSVEYGTYAYKINQIDETRNNQWIRFTGNLTFYRRIFFSGQYEYDWGSDLQGQRIMLDLGYRF